MLVMANTHANKILSLESLRGIAALSVALYHCKNGIFREVSFITNAWLMVDFFFVLSGFVIALNYQNKIRSPREIYNFQLKRFFRLYPLHIFILFSFLMVEVAKYIMQVKFDMMANNPAFSINDLSSFISQIFLIHNFTDQGGTWNFVSWSISAEFYTYLLFAFVVAIFRAKNLINLASCLLVIGSFMFLYEAKTNITPDLHINTGPMRCVFAFFLGVLTVNIFNLVKDKLTFKSSLFPVLSLLIVFATVSYFGDNDSLSSLFLPFVFTLTIFIISLTHTDTLVSKALGNKSLIYLGTISYGVYMIHPLVWWVFTQVMRFVFKVPTSTDAEGNALITLDNMVLETGIVVFGLILIIFLAHLSYKFIELRLNGYRDKFTIAPKGETVEEKPISRKPVIS